MKRSLGRSYCPRELVWVVRFLWDSAQSRLKLNLLAEMIRGERFLEFIKIGLCISKGKIEEMHQSLRTILSSSELQVIPSALTPESD